MTEPVIQKVAIVGAGAIGGLLAGRIGSQLPVQVQLSALSRGETLQRLRRDGLQLNDSQGRRTRIEVLASDDPDELGPQDLVIVAVKAPALVMVAPAVRRMLTPHSRVLVATTGIPWWFCLGLEGPCQDLRLRSVDPHGVLASTLPARQVIGCVMHASAGSSGPGEVTHLAGNTLVIGEPDGAISPALQDVAALLGQAGFDVEMSERIQQDIWNKLWCPMALNPISALTGATCDRILDDPLVRRFARAVMLEAQAIGEYIGCELRQSPEDRQMVLRRLGPLRTSMLQDLEAHRPLEIDALLGAAREIGQHLGLETPSIDALLGMVRLMARQQGLYANSY